MNEKHKLMKPKDPARSGRQASRRAKKWQSRLSAALLCALLFTVFFPSCKDEDLVPSAGTTRADSSSTPPESVNGGAGLVRNGDGTWTATRRVPLVGAGRVIDDISVPLVSVGVMGNNSDELTDLDLTNEFYASGIIDAQLFTNQVVSVRDLNRIYKGGQVVGFVCKNNDESVLSLNVLKNFWVETSLKGKTQERFTFSNISSVIDLGLGNIEGGSNDTSNTFCVENTVSLPFDEVRLGMIGITADIAGKLGIYYAYVGRNEMIPAVETRTDFFYNGVDTPTSPYGWSSWLDHLSNISLPGLTNDDLTDGPLIMLGADLGQPHVTVDFKRTIKPGSEVGFVVTVGGILDLGLGKTIDIRTYDGDDPNKWLEDYSYTRMLSLGLLGGGKTKFSMITTKACSKVFLGFFGLNLDLLSGKQIHYAFVREPDVIDPSSYFSFADAVVYVPNYRFAKPLKEGVTVKYRIDKQPDGATAIIDESDPNLLKGMNVVGDYKIIAEYYESDSTEPMIYEAVITRKAKAVDYCNTPITNKDGETTWKAYNPGGFGGIEVGGGSMDGVLNNIVDDDTHNYIEFTDVNINLVENTGIIGVKSTDNTTINSEKHKIRTGFIISRSSVLLGADVLKFLRIKLYKGGSEVESEVGDDNNGVSLGLIGNNNDAGLARLSIDTDVEFDQIELYSSGVLSLNLGDKLKVYYAFWDEASDECASPGEECMELITSANYNARVSTFTEGLAAVGETAVGMSNIVDGDDASFAEFGSGVLAGTKKTITISFDEIEGGQEVGFIISDITGLINVSLLDFVQVHAYYNDIEVGNNGTEGNALNLKVIGGGNKLYVSTTPPRENQNGEIVKFNRLELVYGDGATITDVFRVYGVFLRPDYDGDGVVDCIEDGLLTDINRFSIETDHICEGNPAPVFVVEDGGIDGKKYTLIFTDYAHPDRDPIRTLAEVSKEADSGRRVLIFESDFFSSLSPGYYGISIDQDIDLTNYCFLTMHPKETTWLGNVDANWNNWSNWSNGVPWDCTDVVIPSPGAEASTVLGIPQNFFVAHYPNLVMDYSRSEIYSAPYYCQNIYFAPGAELVGQHNLHYSGKVFIDTELKSGYYNLMSAPLQNMVTGDMFIAKNASNWEDLRDDAFGNYFNPIDATTYEEQRTNPFIYQRFWSSGDDKVWNETLSRSSTRDDYDNTEDEAIECDLLTTDWSRTFNSVESMYEKGQGFAVRAGDEGATSSNPYTFHFPKSHTSYHYYNNLGTELKGSGTISRTNAGKLWIDGNTANPDLSVTLTRESSGNLFLFGNPMMSHIDIQQFLVENTNVSSVLIYDKDKKEYVAISNGASTSSITRIAPMEAVFLQTGASAQSLAVELSDAMLVQGNSVSRTAAAPNQLRLTATSRGHSASCVVVPSSAASDDYDAREDATLLVGSEEGSGVAVYTVAGGKALSIQRMNSQKRIPVGFYLKEEGSVSLSFDPQGDAWQGWTLVDQQTGKRYPLDSEISLGTVKSGAGRFYLEAD